MRWERSKPLWPIGATLGLLLVFVLAAPGSWQSLDTSSQSEPTAIPQTAPSAVDSPEPQIDLPVEPTVAVPEAGPAWAMPQLSEVQESLAMPHMSAVPQTSIPQASTNPQTSTIPEWFAAQESLAAPLALEVPQRLAILEPVAEPEPGPVLLSPTEELTPAAELPLIVETPPTVEMPQTVEITPPVETTPPVEIPTPVETTPAVEKLVEALPARREFDLDTLVNVRDRLFAILDQVPAIEPASPAPILAPSVRVSSENDRLAMVPRREPVSDSPSAPILPRESIEQKDTEINAVASPALPAAEQSSELTSSTPLIEPQLETIPTEPKPSDVAIPTEPKQIDAVLSVESNTTEVASPEELPTAEPKQIALPPSEPPPLRHRPQALVEQLEGFEANSTGAVWSQQVLAQLRHLTEENSGGQLPVDETLDELEQLYVAGLSQSENPSPPKVHNHWQQTAQALGRRLVLWRLLLDPKQPKIINGSSASTTFLPVLSDVAELLGKEQNGSDWREYLQLDRVAEAMSEGMESPTLTRTKLAQKVLARMASPRLTEAQREFLQTPQLVQLHVALRPWAAGKVNFETLVALVERYEMGHETRYAAVIAQLQQRLKWSAEAQWQALAAHLDEHYRGANMRIAMSGELMNRMMPKQKPIITPVSDRIAGAKVRGRARTTTQLHVRLLPDPDAWHVSLEAFGKVYSNTRSDTWPARIRNAAKMQYQARKEIILDDQGVHVTRAQATAKGRNELVGVDSQLDPVPVLGHMLRDIARQKHRDSRPIALTQVKAKVVRQAKQRMDAALEQKLEALEQKFQDKVLAPLEQLTLLAEPLDIHTTDKRAVMKLRLANSGQLSAHTLRPLAPSDSVLSLQMHETAFNNAMRGLGLDGRRLTMLELFEFISQRFEKVEAAPPEDMPRKAIIKFASHDAVRVRCDGDRLELIFSVVELAHRRDKIKNFQIRVHFRPVLDGLDVKLVRDGTLQFSGRRLKTGPRVVLHSVIGKLIVKDHEINLFNGRLQQDPRLKGLMVTQLVIEDGWVGLALGPAYPTRTAWRGPNPEALSAPFTR